MTKYYGHTNLRKVGELLTHSSRVQFITTGEIRQQEKIERHTGYVVFTVRKRRAKNADARLGFYPFT